MDQTVGNIKITAPPDRVDAEQIFQGEQSRFWELMRIKINRMILDHQATLEQSSDATAIARAQGSVAALRRALDLPSILRKEAQTPTKKR